MEKGWKQVYITRERYRAQMAKDILEQNDVHAVIMNHRDSAYPIGDIELYVREEDEMRSLELLKELK